MTCDEGGPPMSREHSVPAVDQLLVGQDVLAVLIEVLEIGCPLLVGPEGLPAGWVISDMNVRGNLQLGALLPYGVEPRVFRMQALLARQSAALHPRTFIGELSNAAGSLPITSL